MKERGLETFDKWDRGDKWMDVWDRPNKIPKKELFFGEKFIIKNNENFDKRLHKEIDNKFNIAANREVNFRDLAELRHQFIPKKEFELPGTTLKSLGRLLDRYSQEGENGKLRYLLTSGLAVEA